MIHLYDVRYIFVGVIERTCFTIANLSPPQCYSHAGLATLNKMVGHGLRIAYNRDKVTIYQVVGV